MYLDIHIVSSLQDYIEEHYTEAGTNYTEHLDKLHSLRKVQVTTST